MSFQDKRQCCIVERVHVGFGGNDILRHGSVTSCRALVKVKDPAEPQQLYHQMSFWCRISNKDSVERIR